MRTVLAVVAAGFMAMALAGFSEDAQTAAPLQITTESGSVRGVLVPELPRGAAFLGIPYAAQPVGPLRWHAPEAAPAWKGVRDAAEYGPACPQAPSPWLPEMLGIAKMRTGEACLYLNVWTPDLHAQQKLPVLVWVHGGGNVEGSGEWPPLGPALAEQGIVVVSLNYRLGVFGFYADPALDRESPHHVSGNYGHLDQIAALRWVQRNIARFGGDPAKVTIAGESSGALDICNLMASPLAAGLFRGAVMESGVCVDSLYPDARELQTSDAPLAKDAGVAAGSGSLAALRALPAERIMNAAADDGALDFEPAIDGWVLPRQPALAFAQGRQANVAVLVGSNESEVSIFASPLVGRQSNRPKTIAAYRAWLGKKFGTLADRVFAVYPAREDADVPVAFRTMFSDYDFAFGAWLLARDMSPIGKDAWLYRFTYVGRGPFAELGAFHSEELMFLSRHYWTSWVPQPEDAALSQAIIGYWTRFVKTGNPNGSGLSAWPAFRQGGEAQELGRRIAPEAVPRQAGFELFQQYLDARLKKAQ
ncbi:MAG TPA: carboxylesterase family protein [Acidobacteriaceae bacterium]|jgi:para-nitrobenzyl esterase|nr:carboxylesterase family protein [Acidobacteriaceae bacterium]